MQSDSVELTQRNNCWTVDLSGLQMGQACPRAAGCGPAGAESLGESGWCARYGPAGAKGWIRSDNGGPVSYFPSLVSPKCPG